MKTFLSLLSVLFVLIFVSPVFGDNWIQYGTGSQGNIYSYNKDTVKWKTNNIVQVWKREDFSVEGREKRIQGLIGKGLPTNGYDKFSHEMGLIEIDCEEMKRNLLSIVDYDTDGNVLLSSSYNEPDWRYIVPGSVGDGLRKEVCKKSK